MIDANEHRGFLGSKFTDAQQEIVLKIGSRSWTRQQLVQETGVGNFRAAQILTTALRKARIRTIEDLNAVAPEELAMVKGLGEATVFVAMAVLKAQGFNEGLWYGRLSRIRNRVVTFRTMKIREQGRK